MCKVLNDLFGVFSFSSTRFTPKERISLEEATMLAILILYFGTGISQVASQAYVHNMD